MAAPVRRVPIGVRGPTIDEGDPFSVQVGVAAAYVPDDGIFGIAIHDFPVYVGDGSLDNPEQDTGLIHPILDEANAFRVQCANLESEVPAAITQEILGNSYDLAGAHGVMYLDVSAPGTDFEVIDIERTVSKWGDLYPVVIVKCVNPQYVDPSL
jgi:hypothetical protein